MTDTTQYEATETLGAPTESAFVAPLVESAPDFRVAARRTPVRKRAFDLALTVPALMITLPITIVLAVASSVLYRTTPIFNQPRLGRGGTVFTFWKVRTLPAIAPDTADKYQLKALDLPRFARVVRFRHLDELPQLALVLTGKMSLVGPRPEMPTLAASFDREFVDERLTVQPGCTGLWQVSVRARKLIGEHPEFDLHYVRNWTLRLDAWLLYRTVLAMAFHDEIASLDDIPRWTGAAVR